MEPLILVFILSGIVVAVVGLHFYLHDRKVICLGIKAVYKIALELSTAMAYIRNKYFLSAICYLLFSLMLILGCGRPVGIGIGGRYLDAQFDVWRPRGDVNGAITKLEYIVKRDPLYKNSLTLLGRAYYKSRRYQDAFQILKRAVAVNRTDEIAWIALGMTQLRLGDDQRGLESVKGGLTLLAKISKNGYRGTEYWDITGQVRRILRKAIFFAAKGLEEKKRIIRSGEILIDRIDEEEWVLEREELQEERGDSA